MAPVILPSTGPTRRVDHTTSPQTGPPSTSPPCAERRSVLDVRAVTTTAVTAVTATCQERRGEHRQARRWIPVDRTPIVDRRSMRSDDRVIGPMRGSEAPTGRSVDPIDTERRWFSHHRPVLLRRHCDAPIHIRWHSLQRICSGAKARQHLITARRCRSAHRVRFRPKFRSNVI